MFRVLLRLAVVLLGLTVGQAGAELCLDDGVPESQRKYIQDDSGNDIPIGVIECGWASSTFLNNMALMMIQEVLGFHAVIDPRVGASGASPIYALAGCVDFDNAKEKNCGSETKIHVSVDSWSGTHAAAQQKFAKEYPRLAAEDLGSMGYSGEESMYVSHEILHAAYSDSGLALDFYKSYNTTHHDPKKYFDSIHDVDMSELALCNETVMSHPNRMGNYARFSGDYDGVLSQADGSFIAKCSNNRWWYAPACRQNASTCIPVFTGGDGWKLQAMMQWSTAYGIPAAIAISGGWSMFVKHVQSHRALHYWWVPDATFIDMLPEQLQFARHSANEWLAGDKKTGGQGSYVSKMVSNNLQSKAGRVREFVSNINFELPEVQSLLLDVQRWSAWKPVETSSTIEKLEAADGTTDLKIPFVKKGNPEEPLDTYRCTAELFCPGGSPGVCFGDRKGLTCGDCADGYYWASNQCEPCGAVSTAWALSVTLALVCIFGSYYMLTSSYTAKASVMMSTTAALGMLVALFQNLGVLNTVAVQWPDGLEAILNLPHSLPSTLMLLALAVLPVVMWVIMKVFGALVILLAGSFFTAACYAAYQAPKWSGKARLASIRFLVFRFRPDVWYFGLVLLARGPLLSLPGVIATNMPSLQLTLMHMILLGSFGLQVWFLPWKSPILNLVDGLSVSLLVMLLAHSLGYADSSGEEAERVLWTFGTVVSSLMVAILGGMVLLGLCALIYRSSLGSSKELWIMNLGKIPKEQDVFQSLLAVATFLKEDAEGEEQTLIKDLSNLSVYDIRTITHAINILADDLNMTQAMPGRMSSRRIANKCSSSRMSLGR
ncbi:Uncharacterized protein SCF082_LOCUS6566, partial [Durusdinium trenchii]